MYKSPLVYSPSRVEVSPGHEAAVKALQLLRCYVRGNLNIVLNCPTLDVEQQLSAVHGPLVGLLEPLVAEGLERPLSDEFQVVLLDLETRDAAEDLLQEDKELVVVTADSNLLGGRWGG